MRTVTAIRTVLVANRGEIAARVLRTVRSMGLAGVAVYREGDEAHLASADASVIIEGSYADVSEIVRAARVAGADAVHPGYGFGSESASFAAAVEAAGLVWIGPPPEPIATMGDKIAAKEAARAAGIPCLDEGSGFPVIIKAAAGGGGRGMRIVPTKEKLAGATEACRREAAKSFGNDTLFVERYVESARHIEVQIVGDGYGNLIHLGERECSIQRRHQKIIEETPARVSDDLRQRLWAAALTLGRSIGFRSAGTIEFIVDHESDEFYFCEANTRLQVEHPITELVTGLDLVELQIRIARGEELPVAQDEIRFRGHAVEARIYAEDPANGFLPETGSIDALVAPGEDHIRWEGAIRPGDPVGLDFDPMLAKLAAWGESRPTAIERLRRALERLHLGGVVTNREFLVAVLGHNRFRTGPTLTSFVTDEAIESDRPDYDRARVVAALWIQGRNRANAPVLGSIPSGWRNARTPPQRIEFDRGTVKYRRRRDGTFEVGEDVVRVHAWWPDRIDLTVGGLRLSCRVTSVADRIHVQLPAGTASLRVRPRFDPAAASTGGGDHAAPMPGLVADVRVAAGDRVGRGQTLVVLEAMKMEQHVVAAHDGTVSEVLVAEGDQVAKGQELVGLTDG